MIEQNRISPASRVVFVNDGSTDKTWEMIQELHKEDRLFSGIDLSRNRGHQNALLAGLMTVKDIADVTHARLIKNEGWSGGGQGSKVRKAYWPSQKIFCGLQQGNSCGQTRRIYARHSLFYGRSH